MSKILETEKILAVKAYLQGEGTTCSQAARLGVAEPTFREWVTKYKTFGESGLRTSTERMCYTAEIKKAAVTAYLSGQGSQKEICEHYKIKDKKVLRDWIKVYNGHKELRPSKGRGSDIYMTKGKTTTYKERVEGVWWLWVYSPSSFNALNSFFPFAMISAGRSKKIVRKKFSAVSDMGFFIIGS